MTGAPVEIVPYDLHWPLAFEELRAALTEALGGLCVRIEHVGSTSVPGLAAKPIIDIDAVVAREDLPAAIEALWRVGYAHEGDRGIEGREAFACAACDVPRVGPRRAWPAHHLYVCAPGSRALARHIAFRERLRANPELAVEYARLKVSLARQFRLDREAYTTAKTAFIERVLATLSS